MLAFFYERCRAADGTVRLDKLGRFEEPSTDLALVSTCLFKTTVGTDSFHESIGQKSVALRAIRQLCFLGEDIAVVVNFQ